MLLWTLLLACDVPYRVPRVPVDAGERYTERQAWERVRAEIIKGKACFAGQDAYCITDRDFLDRVIQADLDEHFHGRMPLNERWCDEVIGRARAGWNTAMREEQREAVEARVRANWDAPRTEKHGQRVDVHLLVPPGTLSGKKEWRIDTEHEDRGQLDTVELASQLAHWRAKHPKMPVVRLFLEIPVQRGADFVAWDVRHLLDHDVVVVADPDDPEGVWVSARLDGDFGPYLRGEASLHTSTLTRCAAVERIPDLPDCSRHPRVPDGTARRRKKEKEAVPRAGWDPVEEEY